MKYYELDSEEKQILRDFDNNEFVPLEDEGKLKKLYQRYARTTLQKTKNINIRLSEKDLYKLKAKAAKEGIPYQTLAASLLHQATA